MASTWSALKIELLETGANSGTWGTLTNANLGDAVLGEAITGSATVDFASDADVTVTLTDVATTQSARNLRLNITESGAGIGSVRNLILGSGCQIEKFYLVRNNGTGAKTIKNTSGTGISVPAGKSTLVFNDGTNVVDGASYFTSLTLGSALPVASGGTGLTAGTSGGVLAYTATGTLTSSALLTQYGVVYGGGAGAVPVATANGTTGQAFIATTSGAPSWGTLPIAGGGTNSTATATAGGVTYGTGTAYAVTAASTGGYILTSGGAGAPAFIQTLPVANGGTGLTAGTSGGIPAYTASGTLTSSAALAANKVVIGGGAGVVPSTTTLLGTAAALTTGSYIQAVGYADTVTALGNTGTAINLDVTSGGVFTATLNGNATITLRYPVATGASSFVLILTNDATPGRTVAFSGGTFKYPGGSVTRTTTAAAVDIWFFFTPNAGTTYFASIPMANLS